MFALRPQGLCVPRPAGTLVCRESACPRFQRSIAGPSAFHQTVGAGLPDGVFHLLRSELQAQIGFQQSRQIADRGRAVQPLKERPQFGTGDPDGAMVQGGQRVQALAQLPPCQPAGPGPCWRHPGHWKGPRLQGDELVLDQFQKRFAALVPQVECSERAGVGMALTYRHKAPREGGVCRADFVFAANKSEDPWVRRGRWPEIG